MKYIARLLLLVAVAAVLAALVWFAVSHLPPQMFSQGRRIRPYRRRQMEPQLTATISFLGELLIVGVIAFAGRRILRLRL